MLEQIIEQLKELGNDTTKNKYIKDGCDVETYGVKVGDLKTIIKEHKLRGNNDLAIELMETKNFDAMYLAFLIIKPNDIDKALLIKWADYCDYYRIVIHSLAYGIAEHNQLEYIADHFKQLGTDKALSIYYAIYAGKIIIDPNYNTQFIMELAHFIKDNINTVEYQSMPLTKVEMYSLIGYIGMQVESHLNELIELSNQIDENFKVDTNRRIGNNTNFINNCIKHNAIGKKRKSARC